jgi:steroid delta-isomerase-like uncharacterized protein
VRFSAELAGGIGEAGLLNGDFRKVGVGRLVVALLVPLGQRIPLWCCGTSFHTVCLFMNIGTKAGNAIRKQENSVGSPSFRGLAPSGCPRNSQQQRESFIMSAEQNKAVIRQFFDAWNNRRPDAFDDLVKPDVVRHCDAISGVEARSLDQIKEFLAQDTAIFPDSVQTIKLLIAEGNHVAAWVTYEGTQLGPMGPLPPSGRKAHFDFGAVFRIDGGKIAEWWVTWDNMKILRSLGHLPSD